MEPSAFPRRPGPAPSSAPALTAELARPLTDGLIKSPKPQMKKQAVKRHHHKHNLRHRYEFLETLGKGTYGKVKKARESSGRLVSATPSRGEGRARGLAVDGEGCRLGRELEPSLVEWLTFSLCARACVCVVPTGGEACIGPENPNTSPHMMTTRLVKPTAGPECTEDA